MLSEFATLAARQVTLQSSNPKRHQAVATAGQVSEARRRVLMGFAAEGAFTERQVAFVAA